MSDSFDDRRKALEEQYFQKMNQAALERLKTRDHKQQRLSPISGKPMEEITIHGVVVDKCSESGGIWLDAGELEQLMIAAQQEGEQGTNWASGFLKALVGKKC